MSTLRELSESLSSGKVPIREHHPFFPTGDLEEVAENVGFFNWFANFCAIKTGDGMVMVDAGMTANGFDAATMLRRYSAARIARVIYTSGAADHVAGITALEADAAKTRAARPGVIGNRAIAERFDRYRRTAAYSRAAYRRTFPHLDVEWPTEFVNPDTFFDHQFTLAAGNHRFECHHARGPANDQCWIYLPQGKVLFAGDFFIWAVPAAGDPAGPIGYAREWAEALRTMAKVGAEVMVPGHGLPVFGAIRIRQMLNDTADYLQAIYDQTIKLLNDDASLETAIAEVKPPAVLAERSYLRAFYDEPEFIVRNIYRVEGGWYDGAPADLKPAAMAAQGREVTEFAGGTSRVVARAMSLLSGGDTALAAQLIDWAYAAVPDDPAVNQARMQIYSTRAEQSQGLTARGIFKAAARESASKLGLAPP